MASRTSRANVESSLENGLLLDYAEGSGLDSFPEDTGVIYGRKPIFVFKSIGLAYLVHSFGDAYGNALLKLDLSGIPLVTDVNSINAGYEPDTDILYWDHENYVPDPLLPYVYVDEDGETYYIDTYCLLDPDSPETKAAIDFTGTAAVMEDIPPERITVVG